MLRPSRCFLKFNTKSLHYYTSICRVATAQQRVFRICIIGSGPAGFYTAQKILKSFPKNQETQEQEHRVEIDLLEKLTAPYGLVRYGVAPDHPEVKVIYLFENSRSFFMLLLR